MEDLGTVHLGGGDSYHPPLLRNRPRIITPSARMNRFRGLAPAAYNPEDGPGPNPPILEEAYASLLHAQHALASGVVQLRGNSVNPNVDALRQLEANRARMQGYAPFPEDTQRVIDNTVVALEMSELVIVRDLIDAGLTYILPGWLGVPFLAYRQTSRTGTAHRTMDLELRGERAAPAMKMAQLPVFATWANFDFGARELAIGQRSGFPLDTTMIENQVRNVNEAIEDQAWNGAGFNVDGYSAPGFFTDPANEVTYGGASGKEAWDHPDKTPDQIIADINLMTSTLRTLYRNGPYRLYVPAGYNDALNRNYSDGTTTFDYTVRERIERQRYNDQPLTVRQADGMPEDRTLLLQMTRDAVDVIIGQTPATITWTSGSGLTRYWLILACIVTRIKEDYNGAQGFVVGDVP